MRGPSRAGAVLISMVGPMLLFAAGVAVVVWLVGSNWDAFPPAVQTGLRIAAALALVAFFVTSARSGGGKRGF